MKRRGFICSLGVASVGAGIIGTGAVSQITADRGVTLQIVQDPDAYLGLEERSTLATEHSPPTGNGTLRIDLTELNDFTVGSGFNKRASTEVVDPEAEFGGDALFSIRNQADRTTEVAGLTVGDPENLEQSKPNDPTEELEFVDDDDLRVEFFDVTDENRTAIDYDNPRKLVPGDAIGIGVRVIVPESIEKGEHNVVVMFHAVETDS